MSNELFKSEALMVFEIATAVKRRFGEKNAAKFFNFLTNNALSGIKNRKRVDWITREECRTVIPKKDKRKHELKRMEMKGSDPNDEFLQQLRKEREG
ncbi:MAG: hypothetical protein LBB93_03515 [Elusimicrobiota bacterium]|nr:hypothetical protein [Elusimicrobiota bacterium]